MPVRARWTAYAGFSTALAGGVVLKALAQRPNFYSAAVYLSQSSANLMILTNFLFIIACSVLVGLQKLLYGPLRPIEIEQLYEKAWFAITETCLAMTIFRGEIGASFLLMFFALLAGKVWGWIGEGRVEILEQQPPRNPGLFHTRLALSLGLSVVFALTLLEYVIKQVLRMARPDMMVMFGFEFAVLSVSSLSTAARYAINLVEIDIVRDQKRRRADEILKERIDQARNELQRLQQAGPTPTVPVELASTVDQVSTSSNNDSSEVQAARNALREAHEHIDEHEIEVEGWEGKGRWIFYLDLATDFFKLVIYVSFFFILLVFYGLPIHIMRDVFLTFRSFYKRITDFINYRTATRDMNGRYPDATAAEIAREDVCIICREEMRPYEPPGAQAQGQRASNPVAERMRPKKLPCGHILHFSCLRSWLERQQICPTCRTSVVPRTATPGVAGQAGRAGQPADPAGGGQGAHADGQRQGPRIFQWGPLRIGIGAARGGMLDELQRGLADGRAAALRQPNANPNAAREYGFGIRWDIMRRRNPAQNHQNSIHEQIAAIDQRIQQEMRSLTESSHELQVLRMMDRELHRLRSRRQGETATTAPIATTTAPPVPYPVITTPPRPVGAEPHLHPTTGQNTLRTLAMTTQGPTTMLRAGDPNLPVGLTLPEGWTMLPLHPSGPSGTDIRGVSLPGHAIAVPTHAHLLQQFQFPAFPLNTAMQAPQPQTHIPPATMTGQQHVSMPPASQPLSTATIPSHSTPPIVRSTRSRSTSVDTNEAAISWPGVTSTQNHRRGSVQSPLRQTQNNSQSDHPATQTTQSLPAPVARVNGEHPTIAEANSVDENRPTMSLPLWGSPPVPPAQLVRSDMPNAESSEPASSSSTDTMESNEQASKSRNATVEDLIEGPD